jgi:hypothetical protein
LAFPKSHNCSFGAKHESRLNPFGLLLGQIGPSMGSGSLLSPPLYL